MLSNPNNISFDRSEFKNAFPEIGLTFSFGLGYDVIDFKPDGLPGENKSYETLSENVWRVCGITSSDNLKDVFAKFNDRDSYDASRRSVVYACELEGHQNQTEFSTAPLTDFMKYIASFVGDSVGNQCNSLNIALKDNATVEMFKYDINKKELVSVSAGTAKYPSVNSRDGMASLEDILSEAIDNCSPDDGRYRYHSMLNNVKKIKNVLIKAGVQFSEIKTDIGSSTDNNSVKYENMSRDDARIEKYNENMIEAKKLLSVIQSEKEKYSDNNISAANSCGLKPSFLL